MHALLSVSLCRLSHVVFITVLSTVLIVFSRKLCCSQRSFMVWYIKHVVTDLFSTIYPVNCLCIRWQNHSDSVRYLTEMWLYGLKKKTISNLLNALKTSCVIWHIIQLSPGFNFSLMTPPHICWRCLTLRVLHSLSVVIEIGIIDSQAAWI